MKQIALLVLSLFLLTRCTPDEGELCGAWKATAFYENGKTVPVSLDSVRLALTPDHRYRFNSIGFYSESGTWNVATSYLIFTDTTTEPAHERMVKVLYQSADSLKIQMDQNGATQVLFLARIP